MTPPPPLMPSRVKQSGNQLENRVTNCPYSAYYPQTRSVGYWTQTIGWLDTILNCFKCPILLLANWTSLHIKLIKRDWFWNSPLQFLCYMLLFSDAIVRFHWPCTKSHSRNYKRTGFVLPNCPTRQCSNECFGQSTINYCFCTIHLTINIPIKKNDQRFGLIAFWDRFGAHFRKAVFGSSRELKCK